MLFKVTCSSSSFHFLSVPISHCRSFGRLCGTYTELILQGLASWRSISAFLPNSLLLHCAITYSKMKCLFLKSQAPNQIHSHKKLGIFDFLMKSQNAPKMH